MQTFDSENTMPWMPEGTPMAIMRRRMLRSIAMSRGFRRIAPFSRSRKSVMRPELITFAITVAIATPATPRPKAMTRTRFRITFTVPDIKRQ